MYSETRLHLDIRPQVMFKPFFVALRYNMNHHPEEKQTMKKYKRIRKETERLAIRNKPDRIGTTFIHSKTLTPHLHTAYRASKASHTPY